MQNIYPNIVPASYFNFPPELRKIARSDLDAYGVVRPLGNNLFSILVQQEDSWIKNVHLDDFAALGLDRAAAERLALDNVSRLAESNDITRRVQATNSGDHFAMWLGERFTSSCLLWPGLYDWAQRELKTDQLIVMAPQTHFLCISARGTPEFRQALQGMVENIIRELDKHISKRWFELTPQGITPFKVG